MNDLTKTDMLNLRRTMTNGTSVTAGLERADLGRASENRTLPDQIGRRLRSVFPAPEMVQEDEFDSLLKRISTLLP